MENLLSNLENKHLNFKLGEEQRNVLLSIFKFISNSGFNQITLDGFGGSGKTTITKLITKYLEYLKISYVLSTPTHKAKGVLSACTERGVVTLHQLLTLKPNIDILDLDYKDLQFTSNTLDNGIPNKGVIIVDECSMVNKDLFEYIVKMCERKSCKIIWIGDYAQLCPVKEGSLSKAFEITNVLKLTKVYRQQGDNPILDVLFDLRSDHKYKFNDIDSESGSLKTYRNWQSFINDNIEYFKDAVATKNPNKVKLIAYTNARVSAFNSVIRDKIFNSNFEYNIGDLLTAYDSSEYKVNKGFSHNIVNSNDYRVEKVYPSSKTIFGMELKGYNLELYCYELNYTFGVFILSKRDNTKENIAKLASNIENIRLKAVNTQHTGIRNKLWIEYFNIMGSFLTPFDIIFNGRVVRKKTLDYGYCTTSHKS